MSVITFSPVRQSPPVLNLFLDRLARQGYESWFYDDNDEAASTALLEGFTVLEPIDLPSAGDYKRAVSTHIWPGGAVDRVAAIKNYAIDLFLRADASHLFLVDSDVILLPGTIDHLLEVDVPVISSVYWSRWQANQPWMPNVWDGGHYEFWSKESMTRLAEPGHYEVGGLGACTLIERSVLENVRFDPVPNFPMRGEDRWFCMRAGVHGIPLLADGCLTPFHVYRDDQLAEARRWTLVEAERWKADKLDAKWRGSFGP